MEFREKNKKPKKMIDLYLGYAIKVALNIQYTLKLKTCFLLILEKKQILFFNLCQQLTLIQTAFASSDTKSIDCFLFIFS